MTDTVNPLEAAQLAIDELRDENKALRNENAEMMAAIAFAMDLLDNLTTAEFAVGGDAPMRDRFTDILARR